MAELVGKPKESLWEAIDWFTPQLDQLQHKGETVTTEIQPDPEAVSTQLWAKVDSNLIDLANKFGSSYQVRANLAHCAYIS